MSCVAGGTGTTTTTHWTCCTPRLTLLLLLPALLLLLTAGGTTTVSCYPATATTVQRQHHHHPVVSVSSSSSSYPARRWDWESLLLSRSILGLSSSSSAGGSQGGFYLLGGIRRLRRLYCNAGIGFHLEVLPDGTIRGAHQENQYSLIEISAVERGVVSLYGVRSGRFVAMSGRGRLYATTVFHDECKFRESLLANHYNAYESWAHRGSYIALSKRGRAKRGDKATTATTATHFLPRII